VTRGERDDISAASDDDLRAVRRLPVLGDLPNRAVWRITTATSRFGERHGIDWLTYNPLQMTAYHRLARRDASVAISVLSDAFPAAASYADVGAGSGAYAAAAQRQGKHVVAYEYSWSGRVLARRQGVDARRFDLTNSPPGAVDRPVDLAYSLEVAEHLAPRLGPALVHFLVGLAPTVVFTAAPPGAGGLGHVNERPPEYWISCFEAEGARYSARDSQSLAEAFAQAGVRAEWLTERPLVFLR
jgi:SAM-dependent methyltransferase